MLQNRDKACLLLILGEALLSYCRGLVRPGARRRGSLNSSKDLRPSLFGGTVHDELRTILRLAPRDHSSCTDRLVTPFTLLDRTAGDGATGVARELPLPASRTVHQLDAVH